MCARSNPTPRREFVAAATAAAAAGLALGQAKAARPAVPGSPKPNILLIMSDEHNPRISADPANAATIAALHRRLVFELGTDPESTELRARSELAAGYRRTDQRPVNTCNPTACDTAGVYG